MKFLKTLGNVIYTVTGCYISLALVLIVILSFAQVLSRFIFKFSIAWSQELIVFLLIWLVFLGCSMGLRDKEIAKISLLTVRVSPIIQKILGLSVNLILLSFFIVTAITDIELIRFSAMRKSSIMHINMAFVSSAYIVGAITMAFNCFIFLVDEFIDFSIFLKEEKKK